MKSILISIKPKWVAKILNGEKTIEIRKTCPIQLRGDTPIEPKPIDVYIYCTKDNKRYLFDMKHEQPIMRNGKVVAKFTLNKVGRLIYRPNIDKTTKQTNNLSCLTDEELDNYLNKKGGYAWFIEDLVIFDKPKELSEFKIKKKHTRFGTKFDRTYETIEPLTKAPQSWCYVEVE